MRAPIALIGGLLLLAGCSPQARLRPSLAPEVEDFRRMTLNLLAPWEQKIFSRLTDNTSRRAFIEDFWALRDPDPATAENEFRQIMEERYLKVQQMREGTVPGWKTDRGRIYLALGPPDRVEDTPLGFRESDRLKGLVYWIYGAPGAREEVLRFVDTDGFGSYELDTFNSSLSLLGRIRELQNPLSFSPQSQRQPGLLKLRARLGAGRLKLEVPWEELTLEHLATGGLQADLLVLIRSMHTGALLSRQTLQPLVPAERPTQEAHLLLKLPPPPAPGPWQILVRDQKGARTGWTVLKP